MSTATLCSAAEYVPGTSAMRVRSPRRGVLPVVLLAFCTAAALAAGSVLAPAAHAAGCFDEQVRQARGSAALPDCRAYEMVTPQDKNGALIEEIGPTPLIALSSNGQRLITSSYQCFEHAESCVDTRQSEGIPYEFARTGDGWATHPLAPPSATFETYTHYSVSADAGTLLYSAPVPPSEDDFFAREPGGSFVHVGPFGEGQSFANYKNVLVLATPDLAHIVYESSQSFWAFDPTGSEEHLAIAGGLYEYAGAEHQPVERKAPLMVAVKGGFEDHEPVSDCGARLGGGGRSLTRGALSEDGRVVYFTANGREPPSVCPPTERLYVRIDGESADARSVQVSAPTPGTCEEAECQENTSHEKEVERSREASYQGASADGSKVVFLSGQQLTDNASESREGLGCGGESGCNLYESECPHCDELTESQELARRRLIDLSAGAKEHGGPRVQGVVAISPDGSHVYFVARGALTGEEENANHEKPVDGADNLYVYAEGRLVFVAVLSESDERWWERRATFPLAASVTPDGRFLVFTSHRALTVDDTREEGGPAQVFEYDATARTLRRISIGDNGFNADGNQGEGDATIALAYSSPLGGSTEVRTDPTMSHDGAYVFFQSPIGLTPGALNDQPAGCAVEFIGKCLRVAFAQNVYEYHDGRVFLISDGRDTTPQGGPSRFPPVKLLGADASGANVFFATFDQLVPTEDTDTQRDIYDAHICSEAEPCPPPPSGTPAPCEGEACHGGAPALPAGPTPGSATFMGPRNPVPPAPVTPKGRTAAQVRAAKLARALRLCHRKHGRRRRTCERRAHRAYGPASTAGLRTPGP
jgi:hypothetical protein